MIKLGTLLLLISGLVATWPSASSQPPKVSQVLSDALASIEEVENGFLRAVVLGQIAEIQARTGQADAARATFNRALQTVPQTSPVHAVSRAMVLGLIAELQVRAGQEKDANKTFAEALKTVSELRDLSQDRKAFFAFERALSLCVIAGAQARAGLKGAAQSSLNKAVTNANSINNAALRTYVLTEIATLQAQMGQKESAQRTFTHALRESQKISDFSVRYEAIQRIGIAQDRTGYFASALRTVQQIDSPTKRVDVLTTFLQRRTKQDGQTQAIIREIEKALGEMFPVDRDDSLRSLAKTYAWLGQYSLALSTIRQIDELSVRVLALIELAKAQACAGLQDAASITFTQATQEVSRIQDIYQRVLIMNRLAIAQVQTRQITAARATFGAAVQTAQRITNSDTLNAALMLSALAQSQAGQFDMALQTSQQISGISRFATLADVARAQDLAGQKEAARKTLSEVVRTIQQITPIWDKSSLTEALRCVGEAQVDLGLKEAAQKSLTQALRTAQEIENISKRIYELVRIAHALVRVGQESVGLRTLDEALQNARQISDSATREFFISEIASTQAKIGRFHEAARTSQSIDNLATFSRIYRVIEEEAVGAGLVGYVEFKTNALPIETTSALKKWLICYFAYVSRTQEIISRLAEIDELISEVIHYIRAKDFDVAYRIATRIPDDVRRLVLQSTAFLQVKAGQPHEAIRWARALANPYDRTFALLGVAQGLSEPQKSGAESAKNIGSGSKKNSHTKTSTGKDGGRKTLPSAKQDRRRK